MTFQQALIRSGISVHEDVADACRWLESQGFLYGRDFTARNAIDIAGCALIELEHESPS